MRFTPKPMPAAEPGSLLAFVETYLLARDLSCRYAQQVRWSAAKFEKWHGKPIPIAELDSDILNRYLKHLQAAGYAPRTVKRTRNDIMALWRDAFEAALTDIVPRRVIKIKVPRAMPVAWDAEQLQRLLDATDKQKWFFQKSGLRRSTFWRAFVMVCYDTGLRLDDVLALKRSDIQPDGSIPLVQHKTGHLHIARVRPETIEVIDGLFFPEQDPERQDVIFWWPARREQFFVHLRELLRSAGLDNTYGISRRLRRSAASACERENPGTAWRLLGHTAPDLAPRHYIDPRIASRPAPLPPAIMPSAIGGSSLFGSRANSSNGADRKGGAA